MVADLVVRAEDGRIPPNTKDILQGLTGAQFRAGAGLALVDDLIDDLSGVNKEETIAKKLSNYLTNVLGGYLTTFRMFNDFIDQDQEFRTTIPTGDVLTDIGQELGRSVPVYRERFPVVESPTRAAPPGRPAEVRVPFTDIKVPGPISRQLTGITVREQKNPAEKEFDRLGLRRRDILPYTGDKQADQLMSKYMGPVVENVVSRVVISPSYQKLSNPLKERVIREVLKEIRKETNHLLKQKIQEGLHK